MSEAFWVALVLTVYVLFGYPLLLIAVAWCSRREEVVKRTEDFALPSVTLVIPAHNEGKVIESKLLNALALEYPDEKLEILVGSDGSTDDTNKIVAKYANLGVRLLAYEERRGKASVLNDMVASVHSDVLLFCDANVLFRPDALSRLVADLSDRRVGAVTGAVILRSEESNFGSGEGVYYGLERLIQESESAVGSLMGVDGGMYVMRRELYKALSADTILDDFVISMRVIKQGKRVAYQPQAIATENGTPTATQEWRRRVRVAAGAAQSVVRGEFPYPWQGVAFWQYLSHKLLRWGTPAYLVVMFISSMLLMNRHEIYLAAFFAQSVVYSGALIAFFSLRFRSTRVGGVAFYFVMSNVAMLVGLTKGSFNLQPVTWVQAERT